MELMPHESISPWDSAQVLFEVKVWKQIFQKKNRPRNQFIVAIFKFDKIKFKWKLIISDNEKDTAYLSKGKSHQKDIDIITIYAPSIKIPDIKETTLYLSSNIYPHTVIVDDFSTILSPVVKKSGQ